MTASPRCCKLMIRYEAANGPMIDQPECARPEGHAGMCRSGIALARKYAADRDRIYAMRARGVRYDRLRDTRSAGWPGTRRAA
jgi:hypothetical protein